MLALAAVECKSTPVRSGEQALAEEPALGPDPGQHVEEAAADREDVLLERLAVQPFLHREEPVVRLAWNALKSRPWSRRPAPSKPRE